jgi:hypothetical protein
MVGRLNFSLRTQGKYPCVFTDYRDLVGHLRDRSDACFEKATSGSILIPLLGAWLSAIGDRPALKMLTELIPSKLAHCTLQLWLPDLATEDELYIGGQDHGVALCDLRLSGTGEELLDMIWKPARKPITLKNCLRTRQDGGR